MEEIEFSVFDHGADAIAKLRSALADFEARQRIRVRLTVLPFAGAWAKIVQMALYGDGPDVSAIGTSWLGDFVRMAALRPFSPAEVHLLGDATDFFTANWRSAVLADETPGVEPTVWAVPWLADTRICCYRADLFERAGLQAADVFQSAAQLETALIRLRDNVPALPLAIPSHRSRLALHTLASFIWGAGGNFVDEHSGALVVDQPAALAGMRDYFRLGQYLRAAARDCDEVQSDTLFRSGQAAITFTGHWLLQDQAVDPQVKSHLGVAPMIGVPFVGGYHLAIWQYSRKVSAALKLVDFLAGRQASTELYPAFGSAGAPSNPAIIDCPANAALRQLSAHAGARAIISGRPHVGADRKESGRRDPAHLAGRAGVEGRRFGRYLGTVHHPAGEPAAFDTQSVIIDSRYASTLRGAAETHPERNVVKSKDAAAAQLKGRCLC